MTNWKGAAALTVILLEIVDFKVPLLKMSVIASAWLSARFEKLANPAETEAVFVPCSGPAPLETDTETTVLLSLVSTLPY